MTFLSDTNVDDLLDSEGVSTESVKVVIYVFYICAAFNISIWLVVYLLEFIKADFTPIDFIVRDYDDFDYKEGGLFVLIDIYF